MSTKLPAVILADFTTSLATAVAVGATTATIQSNVDDDGVTLPDGLGYFTIDGSNSSKEHIQFVKTGANLASIYSVSRQGTLTSGFARAHRLGATVTLTDFATIKYLNDLLKGSTNLDSSDPLEYDGTATISTANQLATKAYVDGVAIAGSADSSTTVKGIGKVSVAPVSATEPIFVGDNDGRVPTQDENDALAGTSGTPSSSNKYVTNDDTTGTGSVMRGTFNDFLFGDGSDGDVVISTNTTLTRDMYYNNLTINNGINLIAAGYRIFVKGTTTTIGTGNIQQNGGNGGNGAGGSAGAGGTAPTSGTIAGGVAGVSGGFSGSGNAAGNTGTSKTNVIGQLTAVAGASGGGTAGAAGTATVANPTIQAPILPILLSAINVANSTGIFQPTAGSGSGAESQNNGGVRGGGGSGATGGIVMLCSKNIVFSATDSVQVKGGNGGNGVTNGLGNSGSGAGGNGGVIILIYKSISGTTLTTASACAGGTGGTGGNAASNGNNGVIYNYQLV